MISGTKHYRKSMTRELQIDLPSLSYRPLDDTTSQRPQEVWPVSDRPKQTQLLPLTTSQGISKGDRLLWVDIWKGHVTY